MPVPRLGECLVAAGKLSERDLHNALQAQHELGGLLGQVLAQLDPRDYQLAADAARLMEEYRINSLPAVDAGGHLVGALNTHDLMRAKVI